MKKLIYLLSVVLVIAVVFSCKKKKYEPAPETTTTPTSSLSQIISSSQTTYNYYDNGGVVTMDSVVMCVFFSGPNSSSAVNAGTVTLNGTPLTNSSNFYYDYNTFNLTGVQNFSISGSGTLTAFSHSYTASYPKYTGGNLLPDTCYKASGITLSITGISNLSPLMWSKGVRIYQGSNSVNKSLTPSANSVNFSSSELASFNVNNPITISVSLSNVHTFAQGSYNHMFGNTVEYRKYSYLK